MAKQKMVDLDRFAPIRARIVDVYQYSGQRIRDKKTVSTTPLVFVEQNWMVDEIERVAKGPIDDADKERYAKVKQFVKRQVADLEGAIAGGEFVKVSAGIFGMSRFLIKCLERIVFAIDEEAAAEITKTAKMPSAKTSRIEVTLDDDLLDTPEETEKALEDVGGIRTELVGEGEDDDDI